MNHGTDIFRFPPACSRRKLRVSSARAARVRHCHASAWRIAIIEPTTADTFTATSAAVPTPAWPGEFLESVP